MKSKYFQKILYLTIFLVTQLGYSQLSKTHYIPPLTAAESGNANPEDQYFYISTPSLTDVAFKILRISPSGFPIYDTGIVSNTNPQRIDLGTGYGQLFIPSDSYIGEYVINDRGFIIEATDLIYVSVRMEAGGAQAGALVSKGLSALGTDFRVGSFTNENPQTPNNYLNFVSVMATEDGTQVTFDDLPPDLIVKNYSGTFPINTTLNKGESFIVATNSSDVDINKDGLIGTLVKSDKPIVVNCGSTNGSFGNGGGRDYGIDQIVGADKIGKEYIFVRGFGSDDWENVLIVAHEDNTAIYLNGNTTADATIDKGDYHIIEGNKFNSNGNMYVETSKPVFSYQGVGGLGNNGGPSEANQGMFFVPPLDCETNGNVDNIAQIDNIGSVNYQGGVSIVTKLGATITINGSLITQAPLPVEGKPTYVTYKILGLTGNTTVECDNELYCAYFNYNGSATSGSFYSGFPTAPEINFDADFVTLGNCIDNITLEAANMGAFESIEWYYDDGSGGGFIATGVIDKTLTPTFPGLSPFSTGTYKLVGITCKGEEIHSDETPISICPDDTDNDGIIDNIDIDNDNDGILNCTESYGTHDIDFTNITNGSLPFGDFSYLGDVKPIGNTSNNIFGDSNGKITSNVASKNGLVQSSVKYQLNFNKSLNLEVVGNSALTDQDEFIIQVTNEKTITLIDPDDQLLVDTNYDGIYESDIKQFSSFEIHFKIKGTSLTNGTATFKFVSNTVDSFSYKHKNISETSNNSVAFKITATCIPLDSDSDGFNDDFDYDSDNDGIPDIAEGTGTLKILSESDSNYDGLDDIFDINQTSIDTDNDGVPDYIDLDSDNDGIYDLYESGSGLIDSNFDGIIDNFMAGSNGFHNEAETSPDSGLIGYNLNDTDTDLIYDYIDIDIDNDDCFDVTEAGFTDDNFNGRIKGTGLSSKGVILGSDGYLTIPNSNYTIGAPINIIKEPLSQIVCELENTLIKIETNEIDFYQWQVSEDNGLNWANIAATNPNYSNVNTQELVIVNTPISFNNKLYRVQLNTVGNSCDYFSKEVVLTVNLIPVLIPSVTLIQCDDESNDNISFFNLKEAENLVLPDCTTESFEYFKDSQAISNKIEDPTIFEASNDSKVYVRVSSDDGCSSISEINLQVEHTQLDSSVQFDFYECDDFLDADGNNSTNNNKRDGISFFDFSSVTSKIYKKLNTDGSTVTVAYFENEEDALAELNVIDPSNYRNKKYPVLSSSDSHQIYVRIDSQIENACIGLGPHINLYVEEVPFANDFVIERQCDDSTNDGLVLFDTSNLESEILKDLSLTDVTITYFNATGNLLTDISGNLISSPFPNEFLTTSQTVTAKVTNNSSLACFDETFIDFIVDTAPIANQVSINPVCDDESNDGFYDFDTSSIESTILGNQTGMEVSYYDQNGNKLPSPLPNPFNTSSQTISVEVINPLNLNCIAFTSFDFIVNPLPNFTVDSPRIICLTNPQESIFLEANPDDTTELLNYKWYNEKGDFIANTQIAEIFEPGMYIIELTKADGTNCSRTKDIVVNPSEIAAITYNDVIIKDDSDNNTITIITENNNLGIGDYEFSIIDDFHVYQDEAFFNNVEAGLHTVYVRDKNNCGTASLRVSVLGYPKFFTPNYDGYNDTWNVLGLDKEFYPIAKIYIFDRFGKLLKTLNQDGQGWDGIYNGNAMPSTDYWFTAELIDTEGIIRYKKGHFSLIRR